MKMIKQSATDFVSKELQKGEPKKQTSITKEERGKLSQEERMSKKVNKAYETRSKMEVNVVSMLCMIFIFAGKKFFANAETSLQGSIGSIVLLAALKKVKEEEAENEENEKVTPKSKKHYEALATSTKKEAKRLFALPVPPYEAIHPSMGLGKLNASALCGYCQDKITRIDAVIQFATCNPATSVSQGLIDSLWPLAVKKPVEIDSEQRGNMELWAKQLRENFTSTIGSVANLCNGNMRIFSLSGVATRKTPEPNNERCAAPVFKLSGKKGPGNVGVSCPKNKKASKGYICYFGKGEYDKATWDSKTGSSRILIKDLVEGEDYNFIMVAINKLGEGYWPRPQAMSVPKAL